MVKVLLLSGIMAVFGVSVSIAIIAAGGGFSGSGPSLFDPPDASDLFTVGNNIRDGTTLNSSVTIKFTQDSNNENNWQATIGIINKTERSIANSGQDMILLSKEQLTNAGPVNSGFKPYYELLESSLLEIRDIAEGPKYMIVGAQWNSISGEVTTVPVRIASQEKIRIDDLTFDAYVLSYGLGSKTSKIWISKDVPLPIKAEIYDADNQLQYEYELDSYEK